MTGQTVFGVSNCPSLLCVKLSESSVCFGPTPKQSIDQSQSRQVASFDDWSNCPSLRCVLADAKTVN